VWTLNVLQLPSGCVKLLYEVLHGLQGNPCSGAWSTSCPSFFTDLAACRAFSHVFLTPSVTAMCLSLAFLQYCITVSTTSVADGLSCVLWWVHWSCLELSVPNIGQSLVSSHRGNACSLPAPMANDRMARSGAFFSLLRTLGLPRHWWSLDLYSSFSSPSPLTLIKSSGWLLLLFCFLLFFKWDD